MAEHDNSTGYLMLKPDEETEQQRLDLQHEIWLLCLGGGLYTPPLRNEINSILDIGCGTGTWAVAAAKERPCSQVIATDITLPNISLPTNLRVIEKDANKPWDFGCQFSFIHGRMLASGIHDWPLFLSQCWDYLEPNGWIELLDVCHPFRAQNPNFDNDSSSFIRWGHVAERCWAMNGLDYRATARHSERLQALGFVNVREQEVTWPLGEWPAVSHERRLGKLVMDNFSTFLATAGESILAQDPEMPAHAAQTLTADAQEDLNYSCSSKRFYLTMKIHVAQKPNSPYCNPTESNFS